MSKAKEIVEKYSVNEAPKTDMEIEYQKVREAMFRNGWIPLVQIRDAEHFVKGNRRSILYSDGKKFTGSAYITIKPTDRKIIILDK